MRVYTVHEPPAKVDDEPSDPARFVFVRDGFYVWAFLFGPLWMLRHRQWLVLLGYILLMAGAAYGLRRIGAAASVTAAVAVLIHLLVGLEAATLRRFTLWRRGWTNVGIVAGDDLEAAERRFFDAWKLREAEESAPPPRQAATQLPLAPDIARMTTGSGVRR